MMPTVGPLRGTFGVQKSKCGVAVVDCTRWGSNQRSLGLLVSLVFCGPLANPSTGCPWDCVELVATVLRD
eukprot:3197052-Prorocentrum_lima.AAC.1